MKANDRLVSGEGFSDHSRYVCMALECMLVLRLICHQDM